jgi:hypothetical protein
MNAKHLILSAMAILLVGPCSSDAPAAGPPPVRMPQVCSRLYCVEVIPRAPHVPVKFDTSYTFGSGEALTSVELQGGVFVAFRAQYEPKSSTQVQSTRPRWHYQGRTAFASACLNCDSDTDEVRSFIGIALTPVPQEWRNKISASADVCFWRLDMSAAGRGDGRSISIGEKVCVTDEQSADE